MDLFVSSSVAQQALRPAAPPWGPDSKHAISGLLHGRSKAWERVKARPS